MRGVRWIKEVGGSSGGSGVREVAGMGQRESTESSMEWILRQ